MSKSLAESRSNVVHIFTHPKFESTLYPEDDIIKVPLANRYQGYAQRIIEHWESKHLRKPRADRREEAYGYAMSDLVAVMKGQHPRINKKLSVEEIYKAIDNWALAVFDNRYAPRNKKTIRSLDIPRFVYSEYLDRSYLLEYLDPPKTLIKEINPKLTRLLKLYYSKTKWGEFKDNTVTAEHSDFVNASNRVAKYLQDNQNRLLLGLSQKDPDRAAFGLIECASKSANWHNFDTAWLANDWTFKRFATWLKDQGFFRFTPNPPPILV